MRRSPPEKQKDLEFQIHVDSRAAATYDAAAARTERRKCVRTCIGPLTLSGRLGGGLSDSSEQSSCGALSRVNSDPGACRHRSNARCAWDKPLCADAWPSTFLGGRRAATASRLRGMKAQAAPPPCPARTRKVCRTWSPPLRAPPRRTLAAIISQIRTASTQARRFACRTAPRSLSTP